MNSSNLSLNEVFGSPTKMKLVHKLLKPKYENVSISYQEGIWTINKKKFEDSRDKVSSIKILFLKLIHHFYAFFNSSYRKKFNAAIKKMEEALQAKTQKVFQKEIAHSEASLEKPVELEEPREKKQETHFVDHPPLMADKVEQEVITENSKGEEKSDEREVNDPKSAADKIQEKPCELSSHSQNFLNKIKEHLGKDAYEIWTTLLQTFLKKYKRDLVIGCNIQGNFINLKVEKPLRIWFRSVDDKNDEYPIGGIIFSLGDNKYPFYKKSPEANTIIMDLSKKNTLVILNGVESFIKTPQKYLIGKAFLNVMSFGLAKKDLDNLIPDYVQALVEKFAVDKDRFITTGRYKDDGEPKIKKKEDYIKNWGAGATVLEDDVNPEKYIASYLAGRNKKRN